VESNKELDIIDLSKEKKDILLSICILSYNQASEVKRLLNSLSPQITEDVEVVIRDDSTNNETELLVERFSKIIPIRYFHGKKEGIDKTVVFLTKEARGKFVWWLGDDDVVPGGVGKVLEVIKQNQNVTFVWANYRLVNGKELAIDLPVDRFFKNRDELLELGGTALGFVSSTILKRDLALSGIESSNKYIGSAFVNLYLVLHVISQPGKHYYMHGEVVTCHPTTSEEAKASVVKVNGEIHNWAFEVFGINFSNIVREFSNTFSRETIRRTIQKSFGQTWRGILVAYVGGWDTPKGKRIRTLKYFWMFPESWIAFLLFLIPLPIHRILYRFYKALYRNKQQ
jgi:glycosyltransferase involved in cell wall biosynthesis